jgi:hypothetical protein
MAKAMRSAPRRRPRCSSFHVPDPLPAFSFWPSCFYAGYIVIDRDGRLFGYILNFLRDGSTLLPSNLHDLDLLRHEVSWEESSGPRLPSLCTQSISPFCGRTGTVLLP